MLTASRVHTWRLAQITLMVFLVLLGAQATLIYWYSLGGNATPSVQDADAVVVLFDDFDRQGRLGKGSISRAEKAASLVLTKGGGARSSLPILCVGGFRGEARPIGARLLADFLRKRIGVEAALITDSGSWDTVSNLYEIERIARTSGWRKLILVTSSLHQYRLEYLVHRLGSLNIVVVTVEERRAGAIAVVWQSLREALATLLTYVAGPGLLTRVMKAIRVGVMENETGLTGVQADRE